MAELTIPPVLDLRGVRKIYGEGEGEVRAVDGVDLVVEAGEFVAVMGASGSGKSTMMNILGCLDVPTEGSYLLDGIDVASLSERALSVVRNRSIGFIFQSFNLIPSMSARANVELPMLYAGVGAAERRERAQVALELVGLAPRAEHRPNQLSGGQQQRVAVARSLVNAPNLILADEPTGNLDSHSTEEVLDVFERLGHTGRTIVLITHEPDVAARTRRIVRMRDGRIASDGPVTHPAVAATGAVA
ncbi:MAG: ABC transporter ATP-binding protein [Cellulomonas sp.]